MPTIGGIRAGQAYVELGLQDRVSRGLDKVGARMRKFGRTVAQVGAGFTGFGLGITLPLLKSLDDFAEFERTMQRSAVVLDNAEEHMAGFTDEVKRLSIEFGQDLNVLALGLEDILQASVPPEDAIRILETAAKAAVSGSTDVKTATSGIITLMKSYGLEAKHAVALSDSLFTTVRYGRVTFEDLASTMGRVATTMKAANIPLADFAASVATFTRVGLSPELTMTSLQAIAVGFLGATEASRKFAKERFGFDLSSETLAAEGLVGALSHLKGATPEDLKKVFPNIRALRGVVINLQKMSEAAQDVKKIEGAAGATEKAFGKMSSVIAFLRDQLKSAFAVLDIEVGAALGDVFRDWAKSGLNFLQTIIKIVKANKDLVRSIFYVGAIIAAAGSALTALGLSSIVIGAALSGLAATITAIGTTLGVLSGALAFAGGAFLATSAYVRVTGDNFEDFQGTISSVIDIVKGRVASMYESVKKHLELIVALVQGGNLREAFSVLWTYIKLQATEAFSSIADVINMTFQSASVLWVRLKQGASGIFDQASVVALHFWNIINNEADAFAFKMQSVVKIVSLVLGRIASEIKYQVQKTAESIVYVGALLASLAPNSDGTALAESEARLQQLEADKRRSDRETAEDSELTFQSAEIAKTYYAKKAAEERNRYQKALDEQQSPEAALANSLEIAQAASGTIVDASSALAQAGKEYADAMEAAKNATIDTKLKDFYDNLGKDIAESAPLPGQEPVEKTAMEETAKAVKAFVQGAFSGVTQVWNRLGFATETADTRLADNSDKMVDYLEEIKDNTDNAGLAFS